MSTLVTAVIPAYNYAHFLPRAIDSVLAQTYSPVECVVVNDGSTDNTAEVLARYGNRIRAITQENRGLSAARNTGINAARGEFVALLDADDFWLPAKIAQQLAAFEATPQLGAVGCGVELIDSAGEHIAFLDYAQSYPAPPKNWDPISQLRAVAARQFWVSGSGSGAFIPKRTLEDVGAFDETLRAAEDWDMWLRIAAKYPIRNVEDVLVKICLHGSGSFRNAEKMEHNQWKVYEKASMRWSELLDGATFRRMRALILADAGGEYVFAKEYSMALRRYAASLRQWPFHPQRWRRMARLLLKHVGI
jgi:glycosyltransferase involved in cell wall biosynthesis